MKVVFIFKGSHTHDLRQEVPETYKTDFIAFKNIELNSSKRGVTTNLLSVMLSMTSLCQSIGTDFLG